MTAQAQREHFEIERRLADRLRGATSSQERKRLYGEVYRERSERIPQHPLVHRAADPAARAAAVVPQLRLLQPFLSPATRFCELGAGDGAVTRALAPLVDYALALDVTDVLALPSDPTLGYEFRVFDGFDLEIDDNSLDVAYSFDVIEHLHPDDALDHAHAVRRALRPGGVYVCVTQNRLSGPHDISRQFSDTPQGFHLREYTVAELDHVLRRAGFRGVKILLTVDGRRLSPLLPSALVRPLEVVLEPVPVRARRRFARALAAVKVVAVA
jgi:SAM-dependent methyltransferase